MFLLTGGTVFVRQNDTFLTILMLQNDSKMIHPKRDFFTQSKLDTYRRCTPQKVRIDNTPYRVLFL